MGYYTRYKLTVVNQDHNQYALLTQFMATKPETSEGYEWREVFNMTSDNIKWYSYRQDVLNLSVEYPDLVFKLHGDGEEPGDMWNHYFKNGLEQRCKVKIVYDEYDESKLVKPQLGK